MGWYLRKSLSSGPFRLNISKSGLGVSLGVRGARIGTGPRGNYVHLGRGGVYYKKYFPQSTNQGFEPSVAMPQATGLSTPIVSANAADLHDSTSQSLLTEIQQKQKRIRAAPICAVLSFLAVLSMLAVHSPAWIFAVLIPLLVVGHAYLARRDYECKRVVLKYDFSPEARAEYATLLKSVQVFASCGSLWQVLSRQTGVDEKYHGGASQLLDRKPISVRLAVPSHIETDVAVWAIGLGTQTIYLFPDRMLVYQGNTVGAVSYSALSSCGVRESRYVENEGVPSDTRIIGYTWQYVNKDGSPDRRFANNRKIPVVLYGQLLMGSNAGLNLILQSSDVGKAMTLREGLSRYGVAKHIATMR